MSLDNFQGTSDIILQSGDEAIPYTFEITTCSSTTANDGTLPFGTSIESVAVLVYTSEGTDVTTELVSSSSESGNIITVALTYPATSGEGWYKLTLLCTLSLGVVKELDFLRIYAENR